MAELWQLGVLELAGRIRSGEVSSVEVVQAHLDRIAAVNPRINAVTRVLADSAAAEAAEADAALARGDVLGAMHGIPFTVKENIDLAGSATTQAVPALAEAVPPLDSPHIARVRAAGAIPIGRTNLPDFGLRWHSDNALHGATINPWDAARTPGGSSGGDAAALATGMTPLGMGNDYGGSLRWPSQCCGTVALKPTTGRIPQASSLGGPEGPITTQLMAVQGPMARQVVDLRLALTAMHGEDPRDPWSAPLPLEISGPNPPVRVAVVTHLDGHALDPQVAAGVQKAAAHLADAGYLVEEVQPPRLGEAARLWTSLVGVDIGLAFKPGIQPIISPDAAHFLDLFLQGRDLSIGTYLGGLAERGAIAREWSLFFATYPIVLGPVCGRPAFPAGTDLAGAEAVNALLDDMGLVVAINLLGLPSVALTVGVEGGLPQAVQLIGSRFREVWCLDAAEAIEQRAGRFTPIDPIGSA